MTAEAVPSSTSAEAEGGDSDHVFDWGALSTSNPMEVQWAAFYSDCPHEIFPVTSGNRITMTYNLMAVSAPPSTPLNIDTTGGDTIIGTVVQRYLSSLTRSALSNLQLIPCGLFPPPEMITSQSTRNHTARKLSTYTLFVLADSSHTSGLIHNSISFPSDPHLYLLLH